MITIKDLLKKDIHRTFVELWLKLTDDYPSFQKAQQTALNHSQKHHEIKRDVFNLLFENPAATGEKNIKDCPLAVLEALDEFLSIRHGAKADAPAVMVRIKDKTYIVHRRLRQNHHISHVQQTGHMCTHLRYHRIIPEDIRGIRISVVKLPVFCNKNGLGEQKEIRVFIGNFMDDVEPDWNQSHTPDFRAEILTDKERRWKGVLDLLKEAVEHKADILVLPELTVCKDLRGRVADWLDSNSHPFFLALPGTFHQSFDGEYYNYGELYGLRGKPVLSHKKLTTFGKTDGHEKIATGNTLHLLDTPIGLFAMPICLDFCEEGMPFPDLWQKIGVDWHLVPAYGDGKSVRAHSRMAAELNRAHGALTVLSNQPDVLPHASSEVHGFAYHSRKAFGVSPKNRCISVDLEQGVAIVNKNE